MANNPRDKLDAELNRLESAAEDGSISATEAGAIEELAHALDESKVRFEAHDQNGESIALSPNTVINYVRPLRILAANHVDLTTVTAEGINEAVNVRHDDVGTSKPSLRLYQIGARHFYRYFEQFGVDPDSIRLFTDKSSPKHDEADLFTEEDVDALRQACGNTQWPTRNRALLELLIFTGQRITALLTLRIKDVELNPPGNDNNSYIYLNDEYASEHGGGLKGALARGRKRPMFGARKYVRDYLEYHPHRDDPGAWLFVGARSNPKTDPDDHLNDRSATRLLSRIGNTAGVDKPMNPHNFRHYCGTILYRDYDVDFDTIRMLFGHRKDSRVLESIYSHVLDEDFIESAERSLGYREEPEQTPFTPDVCPTCGELLKDGWRQCPNCQEVFGPTDQMESAFEESSEAVTDSALSEELSSEELAALRAINDAVDDPEALVERLATLADD